VRVAVIDSVSISQRELLVEPMGGVAPGERPVRRVLRDLERLGYVELRRDPRDSRARLVELTARGDALVEAMFDAATAAERELESMLTPVQRSELKKTLTALWQRDVFGASSQQAVEPATDVVLGDVAAAHDEAE